MPFDFQAALKAGYNPQQITNYLTAQGRSQEAHDFFDIKTSKNELGITQRIQEDLKKRGQDFIETAKSAQKGIFNQPGGISKTETALQAGGTLAGGINDILGEGVRSVLNAVSPYVPEKIKQVGVDFLQSDVGQAGLQAIKQGTEMYKSWSKNNPRAAKDLESVVNIASLLPIGKGAEIGGKVALETGEQALKSTSRIAGEGALNLGERIQNIVINPKAADIANGFKIENVTKHGLGGTVGEVLDNSHTALKGYRTQLEEIGKNLKQKPTINLLDAVNEVAKKTGERGMKNLGSVSSVETTLKNITDEFDKILPGWQEKVVDFGDAMDAKRAAGLNAAFLHGQIKQGLTADERVWNELYKVLQRATEKAAEGTPFKKINQAMSEIIPIEQAAIRRIPVAERNGVLSLTDLISGIAAISEPKALTVGVLNRGLRSGTVAKNLVKIGKKLTEKK